MVDPARYPRINVFVNKLGIKNSVTLAKTEANLVFIRQIELTLKPVCPIDKTFNFQHLVSIHRHLFQDIYDWAGKIRSYDTKKEDSIFTPGMQILKHSKEVDKCEIDAKKFPNLTLVEQISVIAKYLALINKLHPFPEGNGRTQRLFVSHLAELASLEIQWERLLPDLMSILMARVHRSSQDQPNPNDPEAYEALEKALGKIIVQL